MNAHHSFEQYILSARPQKLKVGKKPYGLLLMFQENQLPDLFAYLNQNSQITELNLKGIIFNSTHMQTLILFIKKNNTLTLLEGLNFNPDKISEESELAFLEALGVNSKLKKIDFIAVSEEMEIGAKSIVARNQEKYCRKQWKDLIGTLRGIGQLVRYLEDSRGIIISSEVIDMISFQIINDSLCFPLMDHDYPLQLKRIIITRLQENFISYRGFEQNTNTNTNLGFFGLSLAKKDKKMSANAPFLVEYNKIVENAQELYFKNFISQSSPQRLCVYDADRPSQRIRENEFPGLFAYLDRHPEITELDLDEISFNGFSMKVFSQLLKRNNTLILLDKLNLYSVSNRYRTTAKCHLVFLKSLRVNTKLTGVQGKANSVMASTIASILAPKKAREQERDRRKQWRELVEILRLLGRLIYFLEKNQGIIVPPEIFANISLQVITHKLDLELQEEQILQLQSQFIYSCGYERGHEQNKGKKISEEAPFVLEYKNVFQIEASPAVNEQLQAYSKAAKDNIKNMKSSIAKDKLARIARDTIGTVKETWSSLFFLLFPPQGINVLQDMIQENESCTNYLYSLSLPSMVAAFLAWPAKDYHQARMLSPHKKDSFSGLLTDFLGFRKGKPIYNFWGMLGLWLIIVPFHLLRMAVTLPWTILKLGIEFLPMACVTGLICLFFLSIKRSQTKFIEALLIFIIFPAVFLCFVAAFIGKAITSPFDVPHLALNLLKKKMREYNISYWHFIFAGIASLLSLAITLAFYIVLWPLAAQAISAAFFPVIAAVIPSFLAWVGMGTVALAMQIFVSLGYKFSKPKPIEPETYSLDARKPIKLFNMNSSYPAPFPPQQLLQKRERKNSLSTFKSSPAISRSRAL